MVTLREVPSPGRKPPEALVRWGQRVGLLSEVPALLRSLGVDPGPVLARAGLTRQSLVRAESRIDFAAMGRLMACGAEATGHPAFGLMVGRHWRLAHLGVVGEVTRNCATLGEALEYHTMHQQANSAGGMAYTMRRAAIVDFGYAVFYPGTPGIDHLMDAALATGFNYVRELVGDAWRPAVVFLPHARPASTVAFREFFGVEPRFNSEVGAMRFAAHWLDYPIRGASPEQKRSAMTALKAASPGVIVQAYRGVRKLLLQGQCTGDELAQMLGMHRRTLNRRLRAEGTAFQTILDDVRVEVARQQLIYTDLGMDDIAASLGYASVAPFMRAFRRVAGVTPGRLRRASRVARSDGDGVVLPDAGSAARLFRLARPKTSGRDDDEPRDPLRPAA